MGADLVDLDALLAASDYNAGNGDMGRIKSLDEIKAMARERTGKICRASAFGLRNLDELAAFFPSLSLKTQGLLDKPSCPTLVVNGKNDLQTPIDDLYLLLEHGGPKSARVFPGGHMGQTPETLPTIVRWLRKELDG